MRLILLGPPGSGKGTQASYVGDHVGIPRISTGDMLRQIAKEETVLGLQIKSMMDSGNLIPDERIIELVQERIKRPDCVKGFILDGFPRTLKQAEALTLARVHIDTVIELYVSDDEIVKRLAGRRIHPGSGRVYHIVYQPPSRPNEDDVTGELLIQREDDKEETIRRRLDVYHVQTQPVASYYLRLAASNVPQAPKYIRIDGAAPPLSVCENIFDQLGIASG